MGLFSKKECCICGEKAGMLTRKKLKDGSFVCGSCLEKCSANMDPEKYRKMEKEDVLAHMKYFEENNEKYENEFKETATICNGEDPIISIDGTHGWWVLNHSAPDIFTFDQMKQFDFDLDTNYLSEEDRKFKNSFIMQVLTYSESRHDLKKCPKNAEIRGMYIDVTMEHPWFDSIRIDIMHSILTTPSDIKSAYSCADDILDFLGNPSAFEVK